ncbi:MAG: hypothetical protein AB7Q00_14805 [Phycisphaerales bacterium]
MVASLITAHNFGGAFAQLDRLFLDPMCPRIHTESWQGEDISKRPEMRSYELLNVVMSVPLRGEQSLPWYQAWIGPNLPWADVHFDERVCGEPLNPPPSYKIWPWGNNAEKFVGEHGEFNHSYPERLWPKFAGRTDKGELKDTKFDPMKPGVTKHEDGSISYYSETRDDVEFYHPHQGIRWEYGDLADVVKLLIKEPYTRQAWIPLFFPEDTGIGDGGRKPCTLGYQFIVRDNKLHIYYPLRSCDYVRHFRDDIYLAIRLLLWVLKECRNATPYERLWHEVRPGTFTMHCTSLHIFANDMIQLREKYHGKQTP